MENEEYIKILLKENKRLNDENIELSADLGFFQNENLSLTKDIEKYWSIEKELGCPLEEAIRKAQKYDKLIEKNRELKEAFDILKYCFTETYGLEGYYQTGCLTVEEYDFLKSVFKKYEIEEDEEDEKED